MVIHLLVFLVKAMVFVIVACLVVPVAPVALILLLSLTGLRCIAALLSGSAEASTPIATHEAARSRAGAEPPN